MLCCCEGEPDELWLWEELDEDELCELCELELLELELVELGMEGMLLLEELDDALGIDGELEELDVDD